ncbi:MAG: tetratricopeptide repeat protein [Phycisphaeraceae bacterium]
MKPRTVLSIFCLLILTCPAWPARSEVSADKQLADEFVRTAISFMGFSQVTDTDAPLVLSGTLLDAALELDPKNAQAWALRAELAQAAGDGERYEAALAGYLATGISDDRARYNLVRHRLSQSETLDARLRSLTDVLNSDAGRAMSGPLRSRLASLASSLAGELLDKQAQRKWAVEAARTDPANTEAARAMLELVIELGGDNVRVGTATVNIIRANPLEPGPRIDLAMLLAQEAAFERAAQQYQVVATRLTTQPMPMPAYLNWAQCMAMNGQDVMALQFIDQLETALQAPPAEQAADGENAATKPVELPIQFDLIRLAVLDGEDDKQAAQAALDRIAKRLSDDAQVADGDAVDPADAEGREPAGDLALIAAAFGPDLDKADALAAELEDGKSAKAIAQGWLAIRRGDRAKAEALLGPHRGKDTMADAGLAVVRGQDPAGRARLLSGVVQQAPGSMAALAAGRALVAMGTSPIPTDTGKTLTNLMGKYPESFWLVDVERTPWLEVRLSIDPLRIQPLEPIHAEITVWNTTRFPLTIGESGPIRQQAMVLITATSSGLPMAPNPPIVVDLGRRFTLAAGERLTFDTRLDYHRFGTIRSTNPGLPFVIDARLLVNPVMTPGGNWLANGIGGVSEVRNVLVQSTPAKATDIGRWTQAMAGSDTAKRIEAMTRLAALSKKIDEGVVTTEMLRQIGTTLVDAWDKGSDAEQALMVIHARELYKDTTSYPELYQLAIKSDSKLVWLALLARQVDTGDAPILREAIGRQDMPDVSRFAERQRRLLREYEEFARQQQAERERQQQGQPGQPGAGDGVIPGQP